MISLKQMQYFAALAEQRQFGRAAEVCHISQPALSMQIKGMEAELGAALVERGAREVVLTPFGREMLGHVRGVLEAARKLEEAARWRRGLTGQLRLGLIPTIAPYVLPGVLAALRARDLTLDVQVSETKTDRLLGALSAGELDAAVLALPVAGDGFHALPLFEDRFLLAGTRGRLGALADVEALRPTELGAAQLMLLEDGHCLTDQALEVCGRGRGHAQINMGASSLGTLVQLVAAGFGLTLMPEIAVRAECAGVPEIALKRFTAPEPARRVGLVRRAGTPDDGWFGDLGAVIAEVGAGLTGAARRGRL